LAIFALSQTAFAADLPNRRRAPRNDYYAAPPVFTWTGFYLGANAGIGFGSFTHGSDQLFGRPVGVQAGLTAGFNYQATPNIVLGIEGDWDLANINNSQNMSYFGFNGKAGVNSLASLRARAGYAYDRALIFVTGGAAAGTMSTSMTRWSWGMIPFYGSSSSFNFGWALGAGVEYAFTDKISAKGEYLFTQLGGKEVYSIAPFAQTVGANVSQVRLGVNYHF
jgi:outer membrane immunogenic protein